MTERLRLIEPVPIEDDLVTRLSHIEDVGFGGRLVYYAEQTCFETGETIHVVKRKIVIPRHGMCIGTRIVRAYLDQRGAPGGAPLRRVK